MKTYSLILVLFLAPVAVFGQYPVFDATNLVNNQLAHAEDIAKWVQSIAQLKTQIDQLNQQISLQSDIRQWQGDPVAAGAVVTLNGLGQQDLAQQYGQVKSVLLSLVNSVASLTNTSQGTYRAIPNVDLNGNPYQPDPLTYRRYSVLDAAQSNSDQVTNQASAREDVLQADIAATVIQVKNATTEAEVLKLTAQLIVLNGQLAQEEAAQLREMDQVMLQKMANDSRNDEETQSAAELSMHDDYLANQRITSFMQSIKLRQNSTGN
jgi:hypothetical protein